MKKLTKTHGILLHLLDELPEAEASSLRAELLLLYGALAGQLEELERMARDYELVAGQIRAKASVQQRKMRLRLKAMET